MLHLQDDRTPVKGLSTEEEEAITPPQNAPQKMKGKELSAHIRTLLAQMEDADKEEFFDDAAKSGF